MVGGCCCECSSAGGTQSRKRGGTGCPSSARSSSRLRSRWPSNPITALAGSRVRRVHRQSVEPSVPCLRHARRCTPPGTPARGLPLPRAGHGEAWAVSAAKSPRTGVSEGVGPCPTDSMTPKSSDKGQPPGLPVHFCCRASQRHEGLFVRHASAVVLSRAGLHAARGRLLFNARASRVGKTERPASTWKSVLDILKGAAEGTVCVRHFHPSAQPSDTPCPQMRNLNPLDTSLFFTQKPRVPPCCTSRALSSGCCRQHLLVLTLKVKSCPSSGTPPLLQVPFSCEFLHEGRPGHIQHRCSQWPLSLRAGSN